MNAKRIVLICLVCLFMSCHTGSERAEQNALPFEVKEDFDANMTASVEDQKDDWEDERPSDPPVYRVSPSYEDDYRVEFDADTLTWVRPGYRTIFHKSAEISTYNEDHPGWPYEATFNISGDFIVDKALGTLRTLDLMQWTAFFKRDDSDSIYTPELHREIKERRRAFDNYYAGMYVPAWLSTSDDKVLHLFECAKSKQVKHLYKLEDFWISCSNIDNVKIHIPPDSDAVNRFDCYLDSLAKKASDEALTPVTKHLGKCEQPFDTADESIDSVFWVSDGLPNVEAHSNGHEFTIYFNHYFNVIANQQYCGIEFTSEECQAGLKDKQPILSFYEIQPLPW